MLLRKVVFLILITTISSSVFAADLLQAYRDAVVSDPVYQQALAQELSTSEGVPISLSSLLPNLGLTVSPSLSRTLASGSALSQSPAGLISDVTPAGVITDTGPFTQRAYTVNLTLTQVLFDFGKFSNLCVAKDIAKQAQAILNAATQDLMVRVARAYLAVLEDEDILAAARSTKTANAKQYDQVNEQYKVGLKTITDVYTSRASFDNSSADVIATETTLADDKENLRVITGMLYNHFDSLSKKFPLISPNPANINTWVDRSTKQNWNIRAAQYAKAASFNNIKQQRAGHLPTLNAQGNYEISYTRGIGNEAVGTVGSLQEHASTVSLNLAVPIFQGGLVTAKTDQAKYDYEVASQKLEQQYRNAVNLSRQSYLGVISGISKINADLQTVLSSKSSLDGMEAEYHVGTETLVNVLNQRQKVFQAEKQYAHDRYAYVNSLLALKQAAGTLTEQDLAIINSWMHKQDVYYHSPVSCAHKHKTKKVAKHQVKTKTTTHLAALHKKG